MHLCVARPPARIMHRCQMISAEDQTDSYWMIQWINFHHTFRSDSTNHINFLAIEKAKHGRVRKWGQHTLVLETQDRNTCSDGCETCDSHGVNNVQLQPRSWTFRSMNRTQTTWCSCPFSNWIKFHQKVLQLEMNHIEPKAILCDENEGQFVSSLRIMKIF